MSASGSYARGEKARSVSDVDAAAYEAAMRKQRVLNARQAAEQERRSTGVVKPQKASAEATNPGYWSEHPGLAESLIPVWGSAREAIADAREGDWIGATFNGALAVSDLAPGAYAVKGIAKGGLKMGGSHTWNATRKWMGRRDMLEPSQPGHHGIIPQGGWGKHVPDAIKNQPFNITAMPSREVHGRIHGRYKGQPQYSAPVRYWLGTPDWAKVAHIWVPTSAGTATDAAHER